MSSSLKSAPSFVDFDLRRLGYIKPFVPEDIQIDYYTFLPYVRTGLSSALVPPSGGSTRATVPVSVTVQDEKGGSQQVTREVTLRGPGDVTGIELPQIIRRVPTPNSRNIEESFLVHVEFDRPELPWLFTPEAPQNERLRPWLVLVVVEASVSRVEPGPAEFPSRLRTQRGQLPSLADSWAWAHAQVVGTKTGGPTIAQRLGESHAPANLSRLMSPRKLNPSTHYIAALVPSYDAGVKAGLGVPGGTLDPAWTRAGNNSDAESEILLPIYDHWRFSTGLKGDFESLAEKLEGVAAPWNVGRRIIDAGNPRGGLAPLGDQDQGRLQVLRCALVSPAPMPPDAPPEGTTWNAAKREELRLRLDTPAQAPNAADLPRVGPRIYARWQRGRAAVGAVGDTHWFEQLNTSPIHRIVAGLGTRVVQKDQEQLMQAAWLQVGEIEAANALLARIQFGRYVSEAVHTRHLSKLNLGELAQVMRPLQAKVRIGGAALTVHGTVGRSATAPAAMTAAFRRATRWRGPLRRFVTAESLVALRTLVGTERRGFTDFRRQHVEPDGVAGLSAAAIAALPAELVARKLGVNPDRARHALAERLAARRGALTVADRLLTPVSKWNVRDREIDLGRIAAETILEAVNAAFPARVASDPGRAEALAPLLVGIGNAGVPELSERANEAVRRIEGRLTHEARTVRMARLVRPVSPFMRREALREAAVARPAARLRFETNASRDVTQTIMASRTVSAQTLASAFSSLVLETGVAALPLTPARPSLALTKATLLEVVEPRSTLSAYARTRLRDVPSWLPPNWFDNGRIDRIMAAPRFNRPMYEALDAYDRDWLVPGLGSIEKTDFVTVLLTNPPFTEGFLVGLSDEMGRELLWRGYPTDQRGTHFWRFWDREEDELGQRIHAFSPMPLGTHLKQSAGGAEGRVVLVVRGDLVKRYPDAIILAMRAGGSEASGKPIFVDPATDATAKARILFHAPLLPDIMLVGFELTATQVRNEAWWFIIAEHPTEPRFGLDLTASPSVNRNSLDWQDLGALAFGRFLSATAKAVNVSVTGGDPDPIPWAQTSAIVAGSLLQNPVRAAFDAKKLVGPFLP